MSRHKGNDPEVIRWLESKEGQRWSRRSRNEVSPRGADYAHGVFGELKSDDEASPMDTKGVLGWMRRNGR